MWKQILEKGHAHLQNKRFDTVWFTHASINIELQVKYKIQYLKHCYDEQAKALLHVIPNV